MWWLVPSFFFLLLGHGAFHFSHLTFRCYCLALIFFCKFQDELILVLGSDIICISPLSDLILSSSKRSLNSRSIMGLSRYEPRGPLTRCSYYLSFKIGYETTS